jgi:2-oxoisovalerate dehydrogenase E2 component (dihydrolipoyl transacylase)
MSTTTNVVMPAMGEGVIEGRVGAWLKQVGDWVEVDEPLLEIETDKVTTEVVAEAAGVLVALRAHEGEMVGVGQVLAVIGAEGMSPAPAPVVEVPVPVPAPVASVVPVVSAPSLPVPPLAHKEDDGEIRAYPRTVNGTRVSPVVARMVAEHGVDVAQVAGTGRGGRVTKKDVEEFLEASQQVSQSAGQQVSQSASQQVSGSASQQVSGSASQPVSQSASQLVSQPTNQPVVGAGDELLKLTGMRRAIAAHMVQSKQVSPHATTFFEFDYTAVSQHRNTHKAAFAQQGIKLTFMPYLVMAVAEALRQHPLANAVWTEEGILLKRGINIGMATAVPTGLIVPVIPNADEFNLLGLSRRINDLAERGRSNKLQPHELQGGTFTVTNHGASGSLMGTPIINQPQAAILGVGLIEKRVKVINDAIAIRPCAYVSFSFDHRILDGATADAFVLSVKARMEGSW